MKNFRKTGYAAVVSLIILLVAGCSGEVTGWKIKAATNHCKSLGGIDYIDNGFPSSVICMDGSVEVFNNLRGN